MKTKNIYVPILLVLSLLMLSRESRAVESKSPALLARGGAELTAAAGTVVLPEETSAGLELSLRIGLHPVLELAGPLGLSIRLLHEPDAGTLYFAFGIGDLYIPGYGTLIYRPTAMLAGNFYIAREATLRGAVDISGAEQARQRGDHPAWLRGSVAVIIDLGPAATLAMGLAYQRVVVEGEHPPHLDRSGWAYDARISFGSVQTQPFSELPFLSIHMQPGLDFIMIGKVDINTDTGNRAFRLLMGMSLTR